MNRYVLLILCFVFSATLFAQRDTKIFTSDIDHFWTAYDSVLTTKDTVRQAEFIQKLYFDKATPGLKDFMVLRQLSAQKQLRSFIKYPGFWTSVRPLTLEIKSYTTDIENLMLRFKELYPKFKQPSVYFAISGLTAGGTTSKDKDKILIGSEIAASDSTVNASELDNWLQGVFRDNKNVVYPVAHELAHTQQRNGYSGNKGDINLLGLCIQEGSCDFIAELLLQKPFISPYITYGKANEKTLWQLFEKEMYGRETKNWLYNGGNNVNPHPDLGYFIGYSICKSYYENAINKEKAVKQIIELNYKKETITNFLIDSKYPDKWE